MQGSFFNIHCTTFRDYHDDYPRQDVLILADALIKFREDLYKVVKMDLSRTVSLPQMSFTALLAHPGKKISYITDPSMYNITEAGAKCGLNIVAKRITEIEDHTKEKILIPVEDYTCTMRELLLIVNLGGLITKTKSILMYKVEPYAKSYLLLLQQLRQDSIANGNKPLSNLLKLMGNGIYGKFDQSNQKYLEVKLITAIEEYEKTVQSQRFINVQFCQLQRKV